MEKVTPSSTPDCQDSAGQKSAKRVIGLDTHPDIISAAILQVSGNAAKAPCLARHKDIAIADLEGWAHTFLSEGDLVVLEASGNAFETVKRLSCLGITALVLESNQVSKTASAYFDDDLIAAERIARAYLTGLAKVVWTPDDATRENRELLHAYQKAKTAEARAVNELRGYLNQHHIRLKNRNPRAQTTQAWILQQSNWSSVRLQLLEDLMSALNLACKRRRELYRMICAEVAINEQMLGCLRLLGVGIINAFSIVAVVGDVDRFATPQKLAAYLGLNPGRVKSGTGKDRKVATGRRGRGDLRRSLIQGAQKVLECSKNHHLAQWGWKLFARKGSRHIAVVAIARRLTVQLWHLLKGHAITMPEQAKPLKTKLGTLCSGMGKALRSELALPSTIADTVDHLLEKIDPFLAQHA